jgi:hypothetical protein
MGTPETLRWSEMELPELDLSLDLGDRDCVFSPPPGEDEMKSLEVKPGPWSEQKKERAVPAALTEEEKKERDSELEIIADRLVATLNAACSRKKKRRK